MQTFVPETTFASIAKVLDRQRLGKQRVEVLQILRANLGMTTGWVNHPCAKMWRGYEAGLAAYGIAMCQEWISRGYKDTCTEKISALITPDPDDLPDWWVVKMLLLLTAQTLFASFLSTTRGSGPASQTTFRMCGQPKNA